MSLPVRIAQELIRCASVTPAEGGALDLLEQYLKPLGFNCTRLPFEGNDSYPVDNLYAQLGTGTPHLCFAGHTDVVPVGKESDWSFNPFCGDTIDGYVCGRGAADMKGSIASFVAALHAYLETHKGFNGTISLLITGDEEAEAINGTRRMLDWLEENNITPDFCIVGEPTSREKLGDMIKIGRRGSFNAKLTVTGKQGHVAYPHLADNPVPKLVTLLSVLKDLQLDAGSADFQPSNLEITTIDVGNAAGNVIPASASAAFNIRFNDHWTGDKLEQHLRKALDTCNIPYDMQVRISGESFYTAPNAYTDMISDAVKTHTGTKPDHSTSGGTSDARFIRRLCPVVECGIVGTTAHQVDEKVLAQDIEDMASIYQDILTRFFK